MKFTIKFFNSNIKKYKGYKAFTLPETLISLAIIGVIAGITIPILIKKQQEAQIITSLTRTYSILTNAFNLALQDNGTPDTWGIDTSVENKKKSITKLLPHLKIIKDCTDGSSGCWPTGVSYGYIGKNRSSQTYGIIDSIDQPKALLADGTSLYAQTVHSACDLDYGNSAALKTVCGYYIVDVNGAKGPNIWGKDLFSFNFTKFGIVPRGSADQTTPSWEVFGECDSEWSAFGYGCTAWVLYNKNFDYLNCNGLSWYGKTTCD